jgi:erythronate-4-phosphate dehydrogenase
MSRLQIVTFFGLFSYLCNIMKIVVDRDIPFLDGILEPFAEVVYLPGERIGAVEVRDADALLVRTRTRCDGALLEGSRVRFVGTATIGFDHIDTAWCATHGVKVAIAAGSNRRGVLQWVSAALACLGEPCATVGVVGAGNTGSLVAEYAAAWGFRVMRSDPPRERAEGLGPEQGFHPLEMLAAQSDIITLHVPLTTIGPYPTRHIVSCDFIRILKPGTVIINSSRGAIIDPKALREAVGREGRFIIDTWNNEPDIDREVLERVLFGTPHIAGYSVQGKATATAVVVNAMAQEFGLPLRDWFPSDGLRSIPRKISWEEMCRMMPQYFDIAAESAALKSSPERFEAMRNNYNYRTEFF